MRFILLGFLGCMVFGCSGSNSTNALDAEVTLLDAGVAPPRGASNRDADSTELDTRMLSDTQLADSQSDIRLVDVQLDTQSIEASRSEIPTEAAADCMRQVIDNGYASPLFSCAAFAYTEKAKDVKVVSGYTVESACRAYIDCNWLNGCKTYMDISESCIGCSTKIYQTDAYPWLRDIIALYCPTFFSY